MAVRILEVDVRDEAFKAFQVAFDKYKTQVDSMPGGWGKVSAATTKAVNPFARIGQIVKETGENIKKATTAQEKYKAAATGTGKVFGTMAQSTKSMAVNIKNATMQLLKWASLTTLFSGLAGAGGLFGIARLAQSASNSRRESQGLGVTPGEREAAKVNYQRYVDVDAMLGKINDARNDVTKRWAFKAAGIEPSDMEGKSNADVLKMLIPALKKTFSDSGGTLQGAQAHGLMEFTDMSTLTRLKVVQQQELDAAQASFDKDRQALGIADKTQAAWQLFNSQLQRAGVMIENAFVSKLVGLTGPLTKLSEAFANAVKIFLDSPKIGKWLDELGRGLEGFAKYLTSDTFKTDVDSFLDAVDRFGGALWSAAKFIGKVFSVGSEKTLKASEYRRLAEIEKTNPALAKREQERLENPAAAAASDKLGLGRQQDVSGLFGVKTQAYMDTELLSKATQAERDLILKLRASAAPKDIRPELPFEKLGKKRAAAPSGERKVMDKFNDLERDKGLPAGLLSSVERTESGGRDVPGPVTKTGERAQGPFQFMAATAKQYGVQDVHNESQAAAGAAAMLKGLLTKYKGDLPKALGAYNWGEGNVDKLGIDHAPKETRDYIVKVMMEMNASTSTRTAGAEPAPANTAQQARPLAFRPAAPLQASLTIFNATGNNIVATANQIAQ